MKKKQLVINALEAGPTIPFPNFSKLFKTWLEILTVLPEDQRTGLFSAYINAISESPQRIITFYLDGILEIFLSLDDEKQRIISESVKKIIDNFEDEKKRKLLLIIPDNAQKYLKLKAFGFSSGFLLSSFAKSTMSPSGVNTPTKIFSCFFKSFR